MFESIHLLHSVLYIILFTLLGFYLGTKWQERKQVKEEEEDYSDEEDYSEDEEEDENPGNMMLICVNCRLQHENGFVCTKRFTYDKGKSLCPVLPCSCRRCQSS